MIKFEMKEIIFGVVIPNTVVGHCPKIVGRVAGRTGH